MVIARIPRVYDDAANKSADGILGSMTPCALGRLAAALRTSLIAAVFIGFGFERAIQAQQPPTRPTVTAPTNPNLPPPTPAGQSIPGPIKADPPGVDFGIVAPNSVVSTTVKIVNPLDHPVKITMAKPSCTCTTVDMVGKVVPANGFIEMPMSMKLTSAIGKKSAQINMVFEGINQVLSVRIDAETAYAVRANPTYIDALAADRMRGSFELISSDGAPFVVKSVDGRPAQTADGLPMKPATRQVVRYDFTGGVGLQGAGVPPFLIVETDHPKCQLLDLRVRHETTKISPKINFAAFRENVGVVPSGGTAEFEFEVKHIGEGRLDRVEPQHKELTAELLSQRSDGDSLFVKVRVKDGGMPKGPFLLPCRFWSGQTTSDLWLYGTVR